MVGSVRAQETDELVHGHRQSVDALPDKVHRLQVPKLVGSCGYSSQQGLVARVLLRCSGEDAFVTRGVVVVVASRGLLALPAARSFAAAFLAGSDLRKMVKKVVCGNRRSIYPL
jgi:hypothetical protein